LEVLLEQKRKDSANYEAEIIAAQKQAKAAQNKLKQEQAKYKQLQEEERRRQSAANQTFKTTNYTSIIDQASGSDLGKKVAKYGCQFIGNPYVMGGTSLTNGADCSGFIYRIYMDFGYRISRTSSEQRSVGTGVSYDQAQPGDIICYDGHVGIYIGGGKIVHASSARTGIKVSNATYRPILAVRRVI
jgi:cell wall-associated NlpC family hydrolase